MMLTSSELKKLAENFGFELSGVASPEDPQLKTAMSRYGDWIENGYGASMDYLKRHAEKKSNPKLFLENVKSIFCVAHVYANEKSISEGSVFHRVLNDPEKALVSLYTRQPDYHQVMQEKLQTLQLFLKKTYQIESRSFVDAQPVFERFWAWRAGLGWIGKNSMLIHRKKGSFFFIGGLFLDAELEVDQPSLDHCGKCRKCIEFCPTEAITEDRAIISDRCIGYHTIENKNEIPNEIADKMGRWIAGCDLCQMVCPWNQSQSQEYENEDVSKIENKNPAFATSLAELSQWDESTFKKNMKPYAMGRMKFSAFKRNIAIAIKNGEKE